MKEMFKELHYDLYLLLLGVVTFFSFIGVIEDYSMFVFVGIAIIMVLMRKSVFYLMPIPFFIQMSSSLLRDNVTVTSTYAAIFGAVLIFDFVYNRKFTRRGYLTVPLLLLLFASIVTHINSPSLFTTFAGFSQVFTILIIYLYFLNTIEPNKENPILFSKMAMYIGMVVSVEMIYKVFTYNGDIFHDLHTRYIELVGWENLNVIIYANLISVPFIAYLIPRSKFKIPYMLCGLLVISGIVISLSRSSLLTLALYGVILVPLMFVIEKNKKQLFIQGSILVIVGVLSIYFLESKGYVSDFFYAMLDRDWTNTDDRVNLTSVAIEQFKQHPLFGSGGLYSSRVYLAEVFSYEPKNYHNTFAQASTLGVFGLFGFVYLFYRKTKLVLQSDDKFKWYMLVMIYITAFVNGMFQPMYFYTTYMLLLFIGLSIIEVNTEKNKKSI